MTSLKSNRLPVPSVLPRRDDLCIWKHACFPDFLRIFRNATSVAMGLLLLAAVILGVQPERARAQVAAESATYTVTFEGNWNTDSTPGGVVSGAHFTTLIGAVHNGDVTFWTVGGTATLGVENVAELGATGAFKSEIDDAGADVKSTVEVSGTSPTGEKAFEIEVSLSHPLFTLLSMIGPSPDWFVGVSGLSLVDESNAWRSSHAIDLFPYDAGTEDGEEFSLNNQPTSPRGTITSLKGRGKFSHTPMARLSFTLNTPLPPAQEEAAEERCAVSRVRDDQSLKKFVECAAESIAASDTFEETLRLLEEFRDDEGNWNDGSTHLVLLTRGGGVYFHANEREVEDLDWSGILYCEGGGSVLDRREGCFMEYGGSSSGYAHPFSASHVPLTHGGDEFFLLGGFDESPAGRPFSGGGEIGRPSTGAGDVDTDDELRKFVEDAGRALRKAVESPEIDPAHLRGVLRQEGPWRERDVYIYIMDETGRVIFDGVDRSREQKDEYGKRYVKDLIADAGKGIVEYTESGLPRRGYAIRVEVPLDVDEGTSRVYVVGSGYRVGEQLGGGGCAVGGGGSSGAFVLFLAALALLLAVSPEKHSAEDKTH